MQSHHYLADFLSNSFILLFFSCELLLSIIFTLDYDSYLTQYTRLSCLKDVIHLFIMSLIRNERSECIIFWISFIIEMFSTSECLWSDFLSRWFVILFHASFIFSLSHFFLKFDHELLLLSTWSLNIHASK